MNREIKFRAWDLHTEKMRYIHSFEFTMDRSVANVDVSDKYERGEISHRKDGEDLIISQFTGLLDNKGIEIYEGDIILCNRVGNSLRDKKIVFFSDGMFTANETGDEKLSSTPIIGIKCEVVGNIYEDKKEGAQTCDTLSSTILS